MSTAITYEAQLRVGGQWKTAFNENEDIDVILDILEQNKKHLPNIDFRIVKKILITELVSRYTRKRQIT